jgi:hypothetical protein
VKRPRRARRYRSPPMARRLPVLLALLAAACGVTSCGRDDGAIGGARGGAPPPVLGAHGDDGGDAAAELGFPAFATKNTLRVGGADAVADAAGVALATFPSQAPDAVALADARDWRTGVLASMLAAAPVRAAVLLTDGSSLPDATRTALERLAPRGAAAIGGAQVVRVGAGTARPDGLRTRDLGGRDVFALGRAVDALQAAAAGRPSDRVVLVPAADPAIAMPAAAWAARSGDAVLFTERDRLPDDTRRAIAARQQPRIYVLGPPSAISDAVLAQLRGLGTVRRIGDADPVRNAIAFARYSDSGFGWGVTDPGHGFTFARADRPGDAAASALPAAHGQYAPLLLVRDPRRLDPALESYLLDVQPGYTRDPVRGVYNRGWILGDDRAISVAAQARIDALLEIQPVSEQSSSAPQGSTQP